MTKINNLKILGLVLFNLDWQVMLGTSSGLKGQILNMTTMHCMSYHLSI